MANKQFVVFTDLDGTLLDHHSYSFEAALPALEQLKQRGVPVVLNSSKTQPEMEHLKQKLGNHAPFIVENGAAVIIPKGALGNDQQSCVNFAEPMDKVIQALNNLREQGYAFRGFHDMSVEAIAGITGLSVAAAELAKQRIATEPLIWQGDDQQLAEFRRMLQLYNLQLIKGGRFYHVMGQYDKGDAMVYLMDQYRKLHPNRKCCSVALGDSPNDRRMLELADYSIVIKGVNSAAVFTDSNKKNLVRSQKAGPAGWNETILELLENQA